MLSSENKLIWRKQSSNGVGMNGNLLFESVARQRILLADATAHALQSLL